MSGFDLSTLQHAELLALRVRLDALMAATAPRLPIIIGDRVCFTWSDSTFYGTVEGFGDDHQHQPSAWLRLAGHSWVHREPLANLRRVCGECSGCRSLAHRPECLQ